MEITRDVELSLYKVTDIEENKFKIVAKDFNDLQEDLITWCIEPSKIELIDDFVYITNWILWTQIKK